MRNSFVRSCENCGTIARPASRIAALSVARTSEYAMSSPSLVIRNGTIVDGSGGDPYEADLSIVDGKIAAIGGNVAKGAEEIDARGKLVTPGCVDVHTHYDAQV